MGQVIELAARREARPRVQAARLTKQEVAAHFKVSVRTITRWMAAGLPFDKPYENGVPRFALRECEAWYSRRR